MQIESTRRWSTCGRVCDNGRFDLMGVGRWQSGGARFLDAKLIEVADTDGGVTLLAQFGKSTPLIDALKVTRLTLSNRFYSALAFRIRAERVLPLFGPALLDSRRTDGSWSASGDLHGFHGGDAFQTALNILTLTTSYRWAT